MEFVTPDAFFSLTVLGYQFPDAEGEPYDANWLRIRVDAAGKHSAWSVVDPCLLTDEVAALADWLAGVRAGSTVPPVISFLQPGLLLRIVNAPGGEPKLRVHFGALFHDPTAGTPAASTNPDRWLDFPLQQIDLSTAERSLRETLRRFPERREG